MSSSIISTSVRVKSRCFVSLLLRGPQTLGELRSRTERMQFFDSLEQVESFLAELAKGDSPLVRVLQARPGQKENSLRAAAFW